MNAVRHVIRSLPLQPASSAASAGSRTVRRPDSHVRLSSKLSDRIDSEVFWGAAGPEVRAWRAACLGRGAFV